MTRCWAVIYCPPTAPSSIPAQEEEAVDFCGEEPPGERARRQHLKDIATRHLSGDLKFYSSTVEFITLIVVSMTQGRRQMGGRNDGRGGGGVLRGSEEEKEEPVCFVLR